MERYLRANLLGPGPRRTKKRIYRAAVSQRLRNTAVDSQSVLTGEGRLLFHFIVLYGRKWLSITCLECRVDLYCSVVCRILALLTL